MINGSPVHIRPYQKEDFQEVILIFRQNVPQYFSTSEEKALVQYLQHEIDEYFVLAHNRTIIGCGGINFSEDKKTGVISWDFLRPDDHGKGYGSQLLAHRIMRLKQLGFRRIVVRTSQHTFKFYEKSRFVLKEIKKDFWAPGFDMYNMELGEETSEILNADDRSQ
jgi:ribosomal-protein-alanine N-acetyltransferase